MNREAKALRVERMPLVFAGDPRRVINRLFLPGRRERLIDVVKQVLALPDAEAGALFEEILERHAHRHRDFEQTLERRFVREVAPLVPDPEAVPPVRRLLLAAYFTMEYSIESAALFNPSIVAHPNQDKVAKGALRVIMSFRAVGEGHISSITFRSGQIHADGSISVDPHSLQVGTPEVLRDALYDRHLFGLKLTEMGDHNDTTAAVLDRLGEYFNLEELHAAMASEVCRGPDPEDLNRAVVDMEWITQSSFESLEWIARSNYELRFEQDRRISERVIFPVSRNESHGIEDARFVRFVEEDGEAVYYATYTAYNGTQILPQLMETRDFYTFKIITLNGRAVQNKGMALFPRKIDGRYVMLGRQDGVNLHIMFSDHLHFWQESQILYRPSRPWEFIQIGNCGSPIETEAGWLVLTHGVGPMRRYSFGAMLLDLKDPTRVVAHLTSPLLEANEAERDGYVPNVVYTCGALVHRNRLVLPYGISDTRCAVATLALPKLLEALLRRAH